MKKLIENQNQKFNDQIIKIQEEYKEQINKQNELFIQAENDRKKMFDEKLKQYETEVKNLNDQIKAKIESTIEESKGISIQFNSNKPELGIMNYLLNPSNGDIGNEIDVTSSSVLDYYCIPQNVVYFNTQKEFYAKEMENNWICFEFKKHQIIPNKYSIISYDGGPNARHPKSWVI